eukprot:9463150-Pyramimonas_sp.AAC.1
MGNRRFPPPSEAALAAFLGEHLPRSMELATARPIHGSLIHVCALPTPPPRYSPCRHSSGPRAASPSKDGPARARKSGWSCALGGAALHRSGW